MDDKKDQMDEKEKDLGEDELVEKKYDDLLEMSKMQDFTLVENLKFLSVQGVNLQGRPTVMVTGAHITVKKPVTLGQILLYTILMLDPISESGYDLVYIQSGSTSANRPAFSWLKKVYKMLPRKYHKNLKALYIIHPSFWAKTSSKVYFQGVVSPKFWGKVSYLESYIDLFKHISRDQIRLPDIMYRYSPIFGTPLKEVLARPDHSFNGLSVPIVVEQTTQYLIENKGVKLPGIFRFNGDKSDIQKLKKEFDRGESVNWENVKDPHIVAGLLKLYLLELPDPIFPYEIYDALIKSYQSQDRLSEIQSVVKQLPSANKTLLSYLLGLIAAVEVCSSVNNMTASNLSIVFAPELVRTPKERSFEIDQHGPIINSIMKIIIEDQEKFLPLLK